jgi:hypothetical protein
MAPQHSAGRTVINTDPFFATDDHTPMNDRFLFIVRTRQGPPDVQRVVFENALVRVTEERMPPGRGVPKHRHHHGITVALAEYQMEQKMYPSGQIIHSNRHFGEINWTETVIHEARNVGTTNQYVVRIELK